MESLGIQWAKYGVIYHQKWAKKIIRRPKRVLSWSITDIELYLSWDAPESQFILGQHLNAQHKVSLMPAPERVHSSRRVCSGSSSLQRGVMGHTCGLIHITATALGFRTTLGHAEQLQCRPHLTAKDNFRAPSQKSMPRREKDRQDQKEKGGSRHSDH